MRVYQLENQWISLNPRNFETINEFFTIFKHLVLQLKQCGEEKKDDQLILSILSKLGSNYSFLCLCTFHIGKLTILNWKMSSLNAFIDSLTKEHDKHVQMGSMTYSKDQYLFDGGTEAKNDKGNPKYKEKTKFYHAKKKEKMR